MTTVQLSQISIQFINKDFLAQLMPVTKDMPSYTAEFFPSQLESLHIKGNPRGYGNSKISAARNLCQVAGDNNGQRMLIDWPEGVSP